MQDKPQSDVVSSEPVQAGPASPLYGICAIVAFVIACLGVFNAMGATAGVVMAIVGILLALVALLETVIPRSRGGRVAIFTVLMAVAAIIISGIRLSGRSVLGNELPPSDPRATPTTMGP